MSKMLIEHIEKHLHVLCNECGNRHVGSAGNRQATEYAAHALSTHGFEVRTSPFDCVEWEAGTVSLKVNEESWPAAVAPYSLPFDGVRELIAISTLEELEEADMTDRIVLLHGDIAREQVMPKNFVFYNPDHHKRLVSLLEKGQPAALVCSTGKNPGTAGSVYPFPLFEDGDFDIPSVTMKDVDGERLLACVGFPARLSFESRRIPATGTNVIGSKGRTGLPELVLCAHIDAKKGTPGALDNATGVAILLGLAELLDDFGGEKRIEIVLFNGEDYYAVPGQMQYLAHLGNRIQEIGLVVNLDGAGHRDSTIAYSFYECPSSIRAIAEKAFFDPSLFVEGDAWVQGDHSMFVMAGCPAIAITSGNFAWLCQEITHTPLDAPALVDCSKLARTATALRALVGQLMESA